MNPSIDRVEDRPPALGPCEGCELARATDVLVLAGEPFAACPECAVVGIEAANEDAR